MRSMTAKDAKNRFGELLLEAQRAPVTIEKNGKPVAVVISYEDHRDIEQAKLDWLRAAINEGVADAEAGNVREFTDEVVDEICARGRSSLEEAG